jgi:hypothetical protein
MWGRRSLLTSGCLSLALAAGLLAGTQPPAADATGTTGVTGIDDGPRLLFTAADVDQVRAVAATAPGATWAAAVRARADAALPRPVATTCERVARYALPDLAMAWLLTGDATYARKARDVLVALPTAPGWSPTSTVPG